MKVTCIQMDMLLGEPEKNFAHAEALIEQAVQEQPDVIVLPETWNVGFFPREGLAELADDDGSAVKTRIGALAQKYGVNIVAGSVANRKADGVYNTAYVFDRSGDVVAEYDKTHLFTPSGEHEFFQKGSHLCRFTLDGVTCGLIICYDIRFPELTRSLTVQGVDLLFVVAQWPNVRTAHLLALGKARAIENQMFLVCCNSCGTAGNTTCGGNSAVYDPWGEVLAQAGENEQLLSAELDFSVVRGIRESINVFRDRRPELYQ
ncbi:MAG: carbon-nitrogen family hydrolase [Oscillospiraceae bacterium]|nr:carbon-nitrogen family hydrolase [Oscillospiraceae bacterium]